jgi:hypothetical protein
LIPGATSLTYTTPPVTEADNGAQFALAAYNLFSGATSAPVALSVLGNPYVVRCEALDVNKVHVFYNKPVNLDGTYQINAEAIGITGTAYGESESIVVLTTAVEIPAMVEHTLVVQDVTAKSSGDLLEPNPTTITFWRSTSPFPWAVGKKDYGWPVGDGGGPNTSFVQENGAISALPGSPSNPEADQQSDNDYYFQGVYTTPLPGVISTYGAYTPLGPVLANEEGAERAFAGGDLDLRYHFNLPGTLKPNDELTVTYAPLNLDDSIAGGIANSRFGIEVYFNGVKVQDNIVMRQAQLNQDFTTQPFTLASVDARVGAGYDNIVSLKGVSYANEGGGNWMGIDYVQLNPVCGALTIAAAPTPGFVVLTWRSTCRLQAAASLTPPVAWVDVDATSPLTVPVPYVHPQFGTLPVLFFRTVSP